MATIMIYEPNEIIAQKLCDSLKKEKYNAIRCDENVIPSFSDDSIPLVMMDAQLRWTTCRPAPSSSGKPARNCGSTICCAAASRLRKPAS